jgi:hypothetical protein
MPNGGECRERAGGRNAAKCPAGGRQREQQTRASAKTHDGDWSLPDDKLIEIAGRSHERHDRVHDGEAENEIAGAQESRARHVHRRTEDEQGETAELPHLVDEIQTAHDARSIVDRSRCQLRHQDVPHAQRENRRRAARPGGRPGGKIPPPEHVPPEEHEKENEQQLAHELYDDADKRNDGGQVAIEHAALR